MTAKNQRIDLLGIATAAGASVRGAGMGPEALRVAGLTEALLDLDREVVDHGDLRRPQPALGTSPASWRLPEERRTDVLDLAARASDQGLEILAAGNFPIFIGGDHSIAMGTVSAVARHCATTGKPVFVLWIDAHSDFNTPSTSPSGNLHGMPLALLCNEAEFDETYRGPWLAHIDPRNVTVIGARSIDRDERRLLHARGVEVIDMRKIDELGVVATMRNVIARVKQVGGHLHVSLDVDAMDPSIAPGGGTLVPGGLSYREAHLIMEMLHDSGVVGSLDVVELNPFLDHGGKSATLLVDLVASLFGRTIMGEEAGPMEFVSGDDQLPPIVTDAGDIGAVRKPISRGNLGPLHALLTAGLPDFLDSNGVLDIRKLSAEMDLTPQAMYKWYDRNKLPAKRASKIVKLSQTNRNLNDSHVPITPEDLWQYLETGD